MAAAQKEVARGVVQLDQEAKLSPTFRFAFALSLQRSLLMRDSSNALLHHATLSGFHLVQSQALLGTCSGKGAAG